MPRTILFIGLLIFVGGCRKDTYSGYPGGQYAAKFIGSWECMVLKTSIYNKYTWTGYSYYSYFPASTGYTVSGEISSNFNYSSYKSDTLYWSGPIPVQSFSQSDDAYFMKMTNGGYVKVRNDTLWCGHWKDLYGNSYYDVQYYSTFVRK